MPRNDHSGPSGQGPRTGRQMGNCRATNPESNLDNNERPRRLRLRQNETPGFQQGRRFGRGKNQQN